jgi:hypothetical protein
MAKQTAQTTTEKDLPGLAEEVLSILRCTSCGRELGESQEGMVCKCCRKTCPRVRGALQLVDKEAYTVSLGFQWNKHEAKILRARNAILLRKQGLHREELAGKLVLDVGCGMGRYAEVVTRWGHAWFALI